MNFIQMLFIALFIASCNKDTVPAPKTPVIPEPVKWEVIPGDYKMYDTLGNYLYDMSISHWGLEMPDGSRRDTFQFNNFDGQFDFKMYQSDANITNLPKYYFYIGSHYPLYDSSNDRWQLYGYDAYYDSDTIHLLYKVHNILYWVGDSRPYELREIKQYGVKQP